MRVGKKFGDQRNYRAATVFRAVRGAAFFCDPPDHLARLHDREAWLGGMGEAEGKQLGRKLAIKFLLRIAADGPRRQNLGASSKANCQPIR